MYRQESDSIGKLSVPKGSYYGVNSQRAYDNFRITENRLDETFIESLVEVKKASALTNIELGEIEENVGLAIVSACDEMLFGRYIDEVIVDPVQGGAGTSSNMNVNEILANRANEILGGRKGIYDLVSPTDDVNRGQSTNDVYPTAGKITCLKKVQSLLKKMKELEAAFIRKQHEFADVMKMGRTQLCDAVPITVGEEFGAYATVTGRNIERLKRVMVEVSSINLGGTAIGTGMLAHEDFSQIVEKYLNKATNLDLTIAIDLIDNTQNVEAFSVLSDCLKTIAISTSKIANDIRLLSSGPKTGIGELIIPGKQNGSSIMPGKINPVIPEVVTQCAFMVVGNNTTISMAVEAGQLELNAFEPVIFYRLFESFQVLENAIDTFIYNCIQDIQVDRERCAELLESSTYLSTPLAKIIGYEKAAEIAKESLASGKTIREIAEKKGISKSVFTKITGKKVTR